MYVHRYLVLRQLLNILHFPTLPRQRVMPLLGPVLPNGPEYPHPQAVLRPSLPEYLPAALVGPSQCPLTAISSQLLGVAALLCHQVCDEAVGIFS